MKLLNTSEHRIWGNLILCFRAITSWVFQVKRMSQHKKDLRVFPWLSVAWYAWLPGQWVTPTTEDSTCSTTRQHQEYPPHPNKCRAASLHPDCFWRKAAHSASANANTHSPTEVPAQMINRGLEVFPPVNYILELQFLFLGSPVSHLLPHSTFAASGCRNWLGSKANWRSKMILYWLFFNKWEVASRETCSYSFSFFYVGGISCFLYFIGTN